ncbi:MAG: hypothetical protein ACXIUB_10825 [Wenzhouxiangella sp.]
MPEPSDVQRYRDINQTALKELLAKYDLAIVEVAIEQNIPGSFWGDEEAGLVGNRVYVRSDTPLHSVLHEACHYVCMDTGRRAGLDTNAGGDYEEENAVCYLQILLADQLPDSGAQRAQQDMDRWGYSFRLGSARAWFENDAQDAKDWLLSRALVTESSEKPGLIPSWRLNTKD